MYIPTIEIPGGWIANQAEWDTDATVLSHFLVCQLAEMTLALHWCTLALGRCGMSIDEKQEPAKIDEVIAPYSQAGVHAKTFLFALDTMQKIVAALTLLKAVPEEVKAASRSLKEKFPDVTGIRDSLLHIDDRARGLFKGKKMDLPDGLTLEVLFGTGLVCTMKDGRLGELQVTRTSLEHVRECVQTVLNAFKWTGEPRQWPSKERMAKYVTTNGYVGNKEKP